MGYIVRAQCSCGVDSFLCIGVGMLDSMSKFEDKTPEYRYWILDIDENSLECVTSCKHINTAPEVISEEDIEQALSGDKKIMCLSCQKDFLSVSRFGLWD